MDYLSLLVTILLLALFRGDYRNMEDWKMVLRERKTGRSSCDRCRIFLSYIFLFL